MQVNSIPPRQLNYWHSNAANVKTASVSVEKHSFSNTETVTNTQERNLSKSDSANIWVELSSKYNVRNATFDDIKAISRALYDAGEISSKVVGVLTFDFERATNYLKQNAPVPIPDSFSMYETPSNSHRERDWIAEYKARAQKALHYGNLINHQYNMKALNILQRLDHL